MSGTEGGQPEVRSLSNLPRHITASRDGHHHAAQCNHARQEEDDEARAPEAPQQGLHHDLPQQRAYDPDAEKVRKENTLVVARELPRLLSNPSGGSRWVRPNCAHALLDDWLLRGQRGHGCAASYWPKGARASSSVGAEQRGARKETAAPRCSQ